MSPKEIEQSLLLAEHYFRSNNYHFAEETLKMIVKKDSSNPKANELLAYIYGNQGNFDLSLQLLRVASSHPDCSPEALYYLGASLLKLKEYESSLDILKKSLIKAGDFFEGLHDAGTACALLDRKKEALSFYLKALNYKQDSPDLFYNIGRLYDDAKQYDEATQYYDRALKLNPQHLQSVINKGINLKQAKSYEIALSYFDKAIEISPTYPEAWGNKGAALNELKRFEEAFDCLKIALEMKPDYSEALSNIGASLNKLKKPHQAIEYLDNAISINSLHAEAWLNRGISFNLLKNQGAALENINQAIDLNPKLIEAWANKALILNELKKPKEALECCDIASQIDPQFSDNIYNKSLILLSAKEFALGFELYDARLSIIEFEFPTPTKTVPVWNGSPQNSNLLVVGEQGVGDEIFFSRFLDKLSKENTTTAIIDKRLINLLSRSFPLVTFIGKEEKIDFKKYMHQIPIGSTPRFLSKNESPNSFNRPYLKPRESTSKQFKNSELFSNKFICGLSWKSTNKDIGKDKSLLPYDLKNILKVSGCEFVNLQYGNVKDEILEVKKQIGIEIIELPHVDLFNDIDGLLSIIDACDIVITTCNVTAHLAGAIGKKTLLLVPYSHGKIWYWHDDEISIWYPSIKQFFQDSDFSWDNAIKSIASYLELEIARKN